MNDWLTAGAEPTIHATLRGSLAPGRRLARAIAAFALMILMVAGTVRSGPGTPTSLGGFVESCRLKRAPHCAASTWPPSRRAR